ncbi:hypothetical protein [Novosphingobium sp.]|uniref:hypothetical protein n=1 Tax=Novosphingobium sp. TaxID=1874826 RepID=UPI00286C606F|nr:hypothetical protein [Novosphingobium sp.]
MMRSVVTMTCLALALGACKGEEKKAAGGTASGEVLPGSVSDAMLPLDTVKSQAPLAPKVEGADKGAAQPGKDATKPAAKPADVQVAPAAPEEPISQE